MDIQLPNGNNLLEDARIHQVEDLGELIKTTRKQQQLSQIDVAGLANCGNRFIVDLESGKKTIQMQKAIEVLELLGLELYVKRKGS